ncbi:UPF0182 family protein [Nocardioides agariphilus]|uniref:UPF0182 protein ISU10_00855 n=1 Tax=Nocardioides agariphilus TaxID=433664 RepID=A0A930VKA8_9ACTN|nr:UPF0182 family protein [Nocardioides agariphilus]
MSDRFDDDLPEDGAEVRRPNGRSRALLITGVVLVLAFFALTTFSTIYTDRLWYSAEGYGNVFSRLFWTRTGLFVIFGLLMAGAVGANMYLAHRFRPFFRPDSPEQAGLERYRDAVLPVRGWLLAGVSAVIGLFAGTAAAGEWRTYMLWANRTSFNRADLYFHKDIGFYVFELPWLHYLVNFAMAALVIALLAAATVHYLYGGIRLQTPGDRLTGAAQVQFSVLLGLFVLAKAADYWLDRFDLVSASGNLIDGITYTDDHAVLPAKNILLGISVICAVLFFLNIWRRTWTLPSVGLALLVLSAVLLGMIWPGIVQAFQVRPTEPDKEAAYIKNNISATREAYDLQDVEVVDYTEGSGVASGDAEAVQADTASVPLVDPELVHDAFEQIQQVRSYYSVSDVLDVDRYNIDGTDRALVLGVRELDQRGLPDDARNWSNLHTVYTHGNGLIAAFANQRPADDAREGTEIQWAQGQQANQNALQQATGDFESRVYYGEQSPDYSIVGKVPGASDVELDLGGGSDSSQATTYAGKGGVQVGSLFRKLVYAVKFGDPNFLLSERVNENSKVLYIRNPRQRVQKVAPWLTVDSDAYPAVVDGRILWIVDGYTTTDRYPLAEKESIDTMTDDSLTQENNLPIVPTDQINYMRNAVKATVDAYDGTVKLYAWDESDPMLQAWRSAFPDTVLPREDMPEELISHLRYPEDLFKVQRYQFARYHVTDPGTFYQKDAWWQVPKDPEQPGKQQPPYRLFVQDPDTGADKFALTSVYVPYKKNNLAAFVSVDSDATDPETYGRIKVLQLPNENTPGPGNIANEMQSDTEVTQLLLPLSTGGSSRVTPGNLLTIPVTGGLMYVQPIYATRQLSDAAYPILRYVVVSYGDEVGIGTTLAEAIADVLGTTTPPPDDGNTDNPPDNNSTIPARVRNLLAQAEDDFAAADRAFAAGKVGQWANLMQEGREKVDEAIRILQEKADSGSGSGTDTGDGTGSDSSSAAP